MSILGDFAYNVGGFKNGENYAYLIKLWPLKMHAKQIKH